MPDQRGPRRPVGQPRRVCPGVPAALRDRLRRRAPRPGRHQVSPEPAGPGRLRPDPPAGRPGRRQPEDRGAAQDARVRGQHHPALSRAIDAAVAGRPVEFDRRDVQEMELSFSRGFSHGFFDGNDHKVLVRGDYAKKRGVFVGEVAAVVGTRVRLDLAAPVKPGDGLVFDGDEAAGVPEQGGRVYEVARVDPRRPAGIRPDRPRGPLRRPRRTGLRPSRPRRPPAPARPEGLEDRRPRADPPAPPDVRGPPSPQGRPRPAPPGRRRRAAPARRPGPNGLGPRWSPMPPFRRPRTGPRPWRIFGTSRPLGGSIFELARFDAEIEGGPLVPRSVLNGLRRELVEPRRRADSSPRRPIADGPVLPALPAGPTEPDRRRPPALSVLCRTTGPDRGGRRRRGRDDLRRFPGHQGIRGGRRRRQGGRRGDDLPRHPPDPEAGRGQHLPLSRQAGGRRPAGPQRGRPCLSAPSRASRSSPTSR